MTRDDAATTRRMALMGMGAAGLAFAGAAASARAETSALQAGTAAPPLWRGEYRARKGEVSLAMYRRRLTAPEPGAAPSPVLFLVHGSSLSALPSFDLAMPGYSIMDVFARWGFDVWTMDHENYGRSSRTDGNSDIRSGVEDLVAGTELVARETGAARVSLFGESSGALRAGSFAVSRPERVDRLVLTALTYTGKGSPTLAKRGEAVEFYRTHNRRPRDRAMILSIGTRDKPGTTDPAVLEAVADAELVYGNDIPTGTYFDMTANLPIVDPAKVQAPVLVVRGEHDGIATEEDCLDFFRRLPNADRQYVVVPGAAHGLVHCVNRQRLWHATRAFLTEPPRLDA